jgi:hypothetical protein
MRSANAIKVQRKSGEAERRDLWFLFTRDKCLGHQPQNSLEFNPPAQPHPQRNLTSERILALERMPREEPNCPWGI